MLFLRRPPGGVRTIRMDAQRDARGPGHPDPPSPSCRAVSLWQDQSTTAGRLEAGAPHTVHEASPQLVEPPTSTPGAASAAGVPPAHCTSGRVPPAQRHDECGGPRRFGPRRRGAGAPAPCVAPRQARTHGVAHRRAAGPGPAADAVWCGGPAAAAVITKARAPARPHEYYSEVVVGEEEAAAEAEGGAAE